MPYPTFFSWIGYLWLGVASLIYKIRTQNLHHFYPKSYARSVICFLMFNEICRHDKFVLFETTQYFRKFEFELWRGKILIYNGQNNMISTSYHRLYFCHAKTLLTISLRWLCRLQVMILYRGTRWVYGVAGVKLTASMCSHDLE